MRLIVATVCAGLAGVLALAQPHQQRAPSGRTPPSGRARARRLDGGSADGGKSTRVSVRRKGALPPRILGDPPGSVHLTNTPEPPDGGVPAVSARMDKLEQQVSELRARSTALEAALRQAQGQEQELQQLNQQMTELRGQINAEAQRKQQAAAQSAAQHQRITGAVSGLLSADQTLAGGSSDIEPALDAAEQAFTGEAAQEVTAAREALRNDDLSQARALLQSAIAHAQQSPAPRQSY